MKKGSKSERDPQKLVSQLDQLRQLNAERPREQWQTLFGADPPPKLRSSLLAQAIAYRLQEKALGGLKPATLRLLERIADDATVRRKVSTTPEKIRVSTGTVLIREWHEASSDRTERRIPLPRKALSFAVADSTSDHGQSLVRSAVLRLEVFR